MYPVNNQKYKKGLGMSWADSALSYTDLEDGWSAHQSFNTSLSTFFSTHNRHTRRFLVVSRLNCCGLLFWGYAKEKSCLTLFFLHCCRRNCSQNRTVYILLEQQAGCKRNVSLHTPTTYGHVVYTDFLLN